MDYFKFDDKTKTWFRTMGQWDPATKKMVFNTFPLKDSRNIMGFDLLLDSEPKPDIIEFGIHETREKYTWGEPKENFRLVIKNPLTNKREIHQFQPTSEDPIGRIAAQAFVKERYSQNLDIGSTIVQPEDFLNW